MRIVRGVLATLHERVADLPAATAAVLLPPELPSLLEPTTLHRLLCHGFAVQDSLPGLGPARAAMAAHEALGLDREGLMRVHQLQGPLNVRRDRIVWLDTDRRGPWEARRGGGAGGREWTETAGALPALDFATRHLRLLPYELNAAVGRLRAAPGAWRDCAARSAWAATALTAGGAVMAAVYDGADEAHYHAHFDESAPGRDGGRRVSAVLYLSSSPGRGGRLRAVVRTRARMPLGLAGAGAGAGAGGLASWLRSGRCPAPQACCRAQLGAACAELPERTRDRRVGMLVALERHRRKKRRAATDSSWAALACALDAEARRDGLRRAGLLGVGAERCSQEEVAVACECRCLCTVAPRPGRVALFLSQHVPHEVTAMDAGRGKRVAATLWMTQRT